MDLHKISIIMDQYCWKLESSNWNYDTDKSSNLCKAAR